MKRLEATGLEPATASRLAGRAPTFVRDIIDNRKQSIRAANAIRLAHVLNTTVEWLIEGRGPEVIDSQAVPSSGSPTSFSRALPGSVTVPEFSAIGRGEDATGINDAEDLKGLWPFSRAVLAELNLSDADLAIVRLTEDSMSPTLLAGDFVLMDRNHRRLPGLFIIREHGDLVAKRLQRIPTPRGAPARVKVMSDNKLLADHEVDAAWVEIIGHVVGVLRRL
jgi:phage repressor protein C with HTH and peptisase S24 domain